jgi:hypothetical protein
MKMSGHLPYGKEPPSPIGKEAGWVSEPIDMVAKTKILFLLGIKSWLSGP